jgi:hypothetical protein
MGGFVGIFYRCEGVSGWGYVVNIYMNYEVKYKRFVGIIYDNSGPVGL